MTLSNLPPANLAAQWRDNAKVWRERAETHPNDPRAEAWNSLAAAAEKRAAGLEKEKGR